MIPFIFLLLLIAILIAWYGMRRTSALFFAVSFIITIAWSLHHMTSYIGLSL